MTKCLACGEDFYPDQGFCDQCAPSTDVGDALIWLSDHPWAIWLAVIAVFGRKKDPSFPPIDETTAKVYALLLLQTEADDDRSRPRKVE